MADRLSTYKNRGKTDQFRKRIKDEVIELRKAKKDDQLLKRRNIDDLDEVSEVDEVEHQQVMDAESNKVQNMGAIVQGLNSPDIDEVLENTRVSRKILSKEVNPPIDEFISHGLVPLFVRLLSSDLCALQFEAAWVLTNIASGNEAQTRVAVDAGVCEAFLVLFNNPQTALNVKEQVLWGLSNIAGTGARYRDVLLEHGILPSLVSLVQSTSSRSLLGTASWCLSNLCRKMDRAPDFDAVRPSIPILNQLLQFESLPVVSDACWALSYFTDGPNIRIQAVCDEGVVGRVVHLLSSCDAKMIVIPALRTLGNIVTGDDRQTQIVIDGGALPALKRLFDHPNISARKEVIWALSNILAGNSAQIQAVLDEGLLDLVVRELATGEYRCRVESTWAISNLTCSGTPDQIASLVRAQGLPPLVTMLESNDTRLIKVTLDAFNNICRAADSLGSRDFITQTLEELDFVERIEILQMHENEEIYKRAVGLMSTYWVSEDETNETSAASKEEFSFKPLEVVSKFSL